MERNKKNREIAGKYYYSNGINHFNQGHCFCYFPTICVQMYMLGQNNNTYMYIHTYSTTCEYLPHSGVVDLSNCWMDYMNTSSISFRLILFPHPHLSTDATSLLSASLSFSLPLSEKKKVFCCCLLLAQQNYFLCIELVSTSATHPTNLVIVIICKL